MKVLTKEQVKDIESQIDKNLAEYVISDQHVKDLYASILYDLNLAGDKYGEGFKIVNRESSLLIDPVIAYMSFLNQLIDVYPDNFQDRDVSLLRDSLRKSTYGALSNELLVNYIKE